LIYDTSKYYYRKYLQKLQEYKHITKISTGMPLRSYLLDDAHVHT